MLVLPLRLEEALRFKYIFFTSVAHTLRAVMFQSCLYFELTRQASFRLGFCFYVLVVAKGYVDCLRDNEIRLSKSH